MLAQQRPSVEARIKSLLNADLKEICKAYGAAVSGTKVVLQKRCIQGECWQCCASIWERCGAELWGSARRQLKVESFSPVKLRSSLPSANCPSECDWRVTEC